MPKQCGLLSPSNVDSEDTKHLPIDTIRPFYQTECDFDHQPTQLSIDFDKYAKNTAHWAQIPFCTDKIVVLNGFESKLLLSEFMLKEGGSVVWQIEHEPTEPSFRQQQSKEDSAYAWQKHFDLVHSIIIKFIGPGSRASDLGAWFLLSSSLFIAIQDDLKQPKYWQTETINQQPNDGSHKKTVKQ